MKEMMENIKIYTAEAEEYLKNAGYLYSENRITMPEAFTKFRGTALTDENYISQSGGLFRAISRKAAEYPRRDLVGMTIKQFSPEVCRQWKYILMHCQPHLDEYFASFLLRACLPDEMYRLIPGETFLESKDNDQIAKQMWSEAAVLGVGNSHTGGATPLLLFDEHVTGEEKEHSSLAVLMKRYMVDRQQLPQSFYQMLKEVDFIDQFGSPHPKSLAVYAKYIQSVPLLTASGAVMSPEWKGALMDAAFAAFYCEMRKEDRSFENTSNWMSALQLSLNDFSKRTYLRKLPQFNASFKKVKNYLTDGFAHSVAQGNLVYQVPNIKKTGKTSPAILNLLVPYLPYLLFNLWGGQIGQILLMPLWECRVQQDILFTRTVERLKSCISSKEEDIIAEKTDIGTLNIRRTKSMRIDDKPVVVIDFLPQPGPGSLPSVNYVIKTLAGGYGFSIFRNQATSSIVLTKGEKIPAGIWEEICNRLTVAEGLSDNTEDCGAWHITRNQNGLAPFMLNGNPTHRYVPKSSVTAQSLTELLDELQSAVSL